MNGCETQPWSVNANASWNEIEKENEIGYHMDDDLDRVELSCYEHY